MEWEFTAEDVVKAKVGYMLKDFRRDLREEIHLNVGNSDGLQFQRTFNLIYDMCYALATGHMLDEFLVLYAYDPPTCEFLRGVEPLMAVNVEMLGAILQRMIMDGVEEGMALEQAVSEAAFRHRQVATAGV